MSKEKKPIIPYKDSIMIAFVIMLLSILFVLPVAAVAPAPVLLDPKTIPKYVNQINGPPPIYVPVSGNYYEVNVTNFSQQILPAPLPKTPVWGYGGMTNLGYVRNSPGPTFEITRGTPVRVKWINELTGEHMFAVDPTLHWADPNGICTVNTTTTPHTCDLSPGIPAGTGMCMYDVAMDMCMFTCPTGGACSAYPPGYALAQTNVPLVTHVHGAEVQSTSDGGPNQWFTANGIQGPDYKSEMGGLTNAAVYMYNNTQEPATLWYHDHALGITRINVMSGLAGFYLLRNLTDPVEQSLPSGKYDVPLAIQDRTFNIDGSFNFPSAGLNPTIHPYWNPEFFGNTILVNGLVWPNMNVDNGTYRFRILDGSNARFYTLSFDNKMPFTQIGTDGGFLKTAVPLTELTIAPGERADILVDFSKLAPGTKVILKNTAKAPTPRGAPADPQTTGQIMQFTVGTTKGAPFPALPANLNPTLAGAYPNLPAPTKTRILTLQEVMGPLGPAEILLDGQKWAAPISELPQVGTTEDWVIVNPTADVHPIHLHLVQFQLVSRQPFQVKKYQTAWTALNGMAPLMAPTVNVPSLAPYLQGKPVLPLPQEQAWKDTIQMRPGEVTTIRVRFAPQAGGSFPFDATSGPGYVWHCHILDHEDNEMMRPYLVTP
jgi:spore coat protein A, manganese oxidase